MKYFTIKELCNSATAKAKGIDNTPSQAVVKNLTALTEKVLDPLREAYGSPIRVSSGYRSPRLNVAVGGVKTSQHQEGHAADLTLNDRAKNKALFETALRLKLPFDQIIYEKGNAQGPQWVHISYDETRNRRQILPADIANKYRSWL
jgi:hypothetical protein